MSAIAGVLCFDGNPAAPGLAAKLAAAMAARGPDAAGRWDGGAVALGHRMLRTTPESLGEAQPLLSEDGALALVMDGRLDNREELRRALLAGGFAPRGGTDAELVLGAYRLWGEDSPRRLLGDFAYAVWDGRRRTLFCAVDAMSARPFYYALNDRVFAFASEEEALIGLPGVSSRPDEAMVAMLLAQDYYYSDDNQRFWLRDVGGLRPGQSISVSADGRHRLSTHWRWEPGEEAAYASDRECEEAFLEVFGEAVRCRLRATGPAAAMMSGGMDSAGIAAMVRRLLPETPGRRFHTYSAIADDPAGCEESLCIQSLTAGAETDAFFVSVPSFRGMIGLEDLAGAAWSRTNPGDNLNLVPLAMCLAAGRQGDRVLLHGVCGDITMYAPDHYAKELFRAGKWREAWRECVAASRNNVYLRGMPPARLLLHGVWGAYMPAWGRRVKHWLTPPPASKALIRPEFALKIGLAERLREQREAPLRGLGQTPQQALAGILNSAFGPELGLTIYERAAGRFGVELRDPWADRRVVEFFLRLPLRQKVRDGWTKHIARAAFAPDLAPRVRRRLGKEHLGPHFITRLLDESGEVVRQALEQAPLLLEEYADLGVLRERYRRGLKSKALEERVFVYEMATLILWLGRLRGLTPDLVQGAEKA